MFALLTAVRLRIAYEAKIEDDGSGDCPPEAMCRVVWDWALL
jgi:hypothetical protein